MRCSGFPESFDAAAGLCSVLSDEFVSCELLRCEVDRLAADDRAQDLGVQDFLRGGRGQVVVQHDHVGEVAGCKLALEPLLVLGEGRAWV